MSYDSRKRLEDLVYEIYKVLLKYVADGEPLSRSVILGDCDFILHRLALNRCKTIGEAADLLMMEKKTFISRLKKLQLWDCRHSELGAAVSPSRKSSMPVITLPMAKG